MRLYYIDPERKEAVCIVTKAVNIAKYLAEELGLVKVYERLFYEYRLNHNEKVLVL